MIGIFIFITVSSCAYSYKTISTPATTMHPLKNIISDYSVTLPDYALNELYFSMNREEYTPLQIEKAQISHLNQHKNAQTHLSGVDNEHTKTITRTEINPVSFASPPSQQLFIYDILSPFFSIFLNIFIVNIHKFMNFRN